MNSHIAQHLHSDDQVTNGKAHRPDHRGEILSLAAAGLQRICEAEAAYAPMRWLEAVHTAEAGRPAQAAANIVPEREWHALGGDQASVAATRATERPKLVVRVLAPAKDIIFAVHALTALRNVASHQRNATGSSELSHDHRVLLTHFEAVPGHPGGVQKAFHVEDILDGEWNSMQRRQLVERAIFSCLNCLLVAQFGELQGFLEIFLGDETEFDSKVANT